MKRKRVEVRRLAGSRVLRIEGSFASWYRPGRVLAGPVWNALAGPIAWLPPQRRRSILILGLGGGSAARIARALAPAARIVGVELDADVVRAARESFDLDDLDLEVVIDDARRFLVRERRRYDVVVEDLFVGSSRRVHKPDWLADRGLALAAKRVARGGLLVSNAIDEAGAVGRRVAQLFPASVQISLADYDNRIAVGGPAELGARALRTALGADPLLRSSLRGMAFRSLAGSR